jgi:hypothetical protein
LIAAVARAGLHGHADAAVGRLVPDAARGDGVGEELDAVRGIGSRGDLDDPCCNDSFVGGHVPRQCVHINGGAALAERGEQHPSFEDEIVGVCRAAQPGQPPFDRVKGQ